MLNCIFCKSTTLFLEERFIPVRGKIMDFYCPGCDVDYTAIVNFVNLSDEDKERYKGCMLATYDQLVEDVFDTTESVVFEEEVCVEEEE